MPGVPVIGPELAVPTDPLDPLDPPALLTGRGIGAVGIDGTAIGVGCAMYVGSTAIDPMTSDEVVEPSGV